MMFDLIGWVGAIFYILGYGLMAIHRLSSEKKMFHLFNIIGAVGVTVAAWSNHDIPSIGLNVAWGFIALYGLLTSR
jgi:hypothetical protein